MGLNRKSISIIIPTYNAEKYMSRLLLSLNIQTIENKEILVIDSSSKDNTVQIAEALGANVIVIPKEEFDHGTTRTAAARKAKGDIFVFMTQDALPFDKYSIENLIKPFFENKKVGVVYGRQLPHKNARPFAAHLRLFNYPSNSHLYSIKDKEQHGLKTCFCSNSFAAYRKSALEEIGWFKNGLIVGEDSYATARMLMKNYLIAYASDAKVYHSHNYTVKQEFERYFDVGVFHSREKWLIEEFGKASGEGIKYILSEANFLLNKRYYYLAHEFFIRNSMKFIGYKLGLKHKKLPIWLVKKLSMHKNWWEKARNRS